MKIYRYAALTLSLLFAAVLCLYSPLSPGGGQASADGVDHVSISELIENMEEYDGDTVVISGEAIGDIMIRGDHAWLTVNDDSYSENSLEEGGEYSGVSNIGIGVWAPSSEVQSIENLGSYTEKGDIVEVTGVFHRACSEHGGDTDIHAYSIRVIEDGHAVEHPFSYGKLFVAAILAGLVVFLLVLWNRRRRESE
ncbi:MAG: hypothetical protein JW854_07570 [Actinobacteria bacterium]|nr:hypothetical protein [Actinomycetota bacterium]